MKELFRWKLGVLLLSVLLTVGTSCVFSKDKAIAEQAVVQFHNDFNSGKYEEIYQNGDEVSRKAQSPSDVLAYFNTIHQKLGAFKTSTVVGWRVNKFSTETTAVLQYDTEFAQGKAREQFTFVLGGGKAALRKYWVSSPLYGL